MLILQASLVSVYFGIKNASQNFKGGTESLQIKEASDREELKQCNEETEKSHVDFDQQHFCFGNLSQDSWRRKHRGGSRDFFRRKIRLWLPNSVNCATCTVSFLRREANGSKICDSPFLLIAFIARTKRGIRMSLNSHHTNHPTRFGLQKAVCQKLATTAFSTKPAVDTWGSWASEKFG